MEKKSNHQANVVRVEALLPHTNADSLELIHIGGYQAVVRKGQFKVGDLAVYVQPDSVVPQTEAFKFIWEPYVGLDGLVPEKRRRITVRKFRKEISEGLLLPLLDFPYNYLRWTEGDDVSTDLGITHYEPEELANTKGETVTAPRRKYPKTLKGWFFFLLHKIGLGFGWAGQSLAMEVDFEAPAYDVEALKNFKNTFEDGEQVYVTEKIHGSNARFLFLDGTMYAGSHYQWKSPKSTCVFRKALVQLPWIEEWCRANEGSILYGEITPTQKGFNYGTNDIQFFAFDIRTPDGVWTKPYSFTEMVCKEDATCHQNLRVAGGTIVTTAPVLYVGPYDLEKIKAEFVDGQSMVSGAKNIREGVVITPLTERHVRGLGRLQLKLVSNEYLEKDSK